MVTAKKTLPNSRIRLTLTATADQFRAAFDKELESVKDSVHVEGFRPGKAPAAKLIERVGRTRLEAGALDRVVSQVYYESLQEEKLVPVASPQVEITEFTAPGEATSAEEKAVTFTVEVDIVPEVKVDGYKKIKIKKPSVKETKEEEVERVTDYLRKQQATLKEAGEGDVLQNGMWADIAYEGSVDGVKRTDMASKNHPIVVGEGQLIPGFEENMVGMKKGESKTFPVTFPKDYHAKELAGKKAEFSVTINEMKHVTMPELDDEFAKHFGHDTKEVLLAAIQENLKEEKEEENRREVEESVIEQLLKVAKFELPLSLVDQELERLFKESQERLQGMQFQWEEYMARTGKTMEQLKEEMRPQAEKNVKIGLALGKVIQEEEITDKEEAPRLALERLVEIATR